jgi:predicted RNA-binding protein YlqC (UPF0109 family)
MQDYPRGSPDDQYVHVEDADELRHWSMLLAIDPEELTKIVARTGSRAAAVRAFLKNSRRDKNA